MPAVNRKIVVAASRTCGDEINAMSEVIGGSDKAADKSC